jgi:hypothetical protein
MGSIEGCLRYSEPRKVNEIALTDLRVKQALYQLSYDPDKRRLYSLHQQVFAIFGKLASRNHSETPADAGVALAPGRVSPPPL